MIYFRQWVNWKCVWSPVQEMSDGDFHNRYGQQGSYPAKIYQTGKAPADPQKEYRRMTSASTVRNMILLCNDEEIKRHNDRVHSYKKQRANKINTSVIANTDQNFSIGVAFGNGATQGTSRSFKIEGDDLVQWKIVLARRIHSKTVVLHPMFAANNGSIQGVAGPLIAGICTVPGMRVWPSSVPGEEGIRRWDQANEKWMNEKGIIQYALNTMRFAQMKWLHARKNKEIMAILMNSMVDFWKDVCDHFPSHIEVHIAMEMMNRIDAIGDRQEIKKVNGATFTQYKFRGKTKGVSDIVVNSW